MKKIIVILLIVLSVFSLFATTTYTVETNAGTQEVVIPDGMTELDVLLYLAKSYYNLYDEYEILQAKSEALTETIKTYVDENRELKVQYNEALAKYEKLISSYKALQSSNNFKGLVLAGLNFNNEFQHVSLGGGVLLFQRIGLVTNLNIPVNGEKVSFGLSFLFSF